MYVAVKGGEKAIENAHRLLAVERRGNTGTLELSIDQIREQLSMAVDRVMTEGSLYDPDLAALAIKQACGDLAEAVFLLRAYRTTLPRFAYSQTIETSKMGIRRRISATFKDLPGGQILGPTFDYTHRLLDFSLELRQSSYAEQDDAPLPPSRGESTGVTLQNKVDKVPAAHEHEIEKAADGKLPVDEHMPKVVDLLDRESLIEIEKQGDEDMPVGDITRQPLTLPAGRDVRLQALARNDEGFMLALAYSSQRGFGANHPFVGEIRMGEVAVAITPDELGFPIEIGEITVTECDMITHFKGSKDKPPQFTRGYGLTFGYCERKAISMSIVDRALRCREFGEDVAAPAQDEEFVLSHGDNVESSGFVQHLKLPHHVDFQADLVLVRQMRAEYVANREKRSTECAEEPPL